MLRGRGSLSQLLTSHRLDTEFRRQDEPGNAASVAEWQPLGVQNVTQQESNGEYSHDNRRDDGEEDLSLLTNQSSLDLV